MTIPVFLYFQWELLSPGTTNPFKYMLMIQYPVPGTSDPVMYQKGYGVSARASPPRSCRTPSPMHMITTCSRPLNQDLAFLAYYVIVFSFLRQVCTLHFLRPLAWKLGIKKEAKLDRFAEQGYAVMYFSVSGTLGLVRRSAVD